MRRRRSDKKAATPTTPVLDLDALYSVNEIAPWMRLSTDTVLQMAREKRIPVVRLNERVIRFHPRTILAQAR
jgi:excisionase family DNA binding protein